jgi:hypothetical protein
VGRGRQPKRDLTVSCGRCRRREKRVDGETETDLRPEVKR